MRSSRLSWIAANTSSTSWPSAEEDGGVSEPVARTDDEGAANGDTSSDNGKNGHANSIVDNVDADAEDDGDAETDPNANEKNVDAKDAVVESDDDDKVEVEDVAVVGDGYNGDSAFASEDYVDIDENGNDSDDPAYEGIDEKPPSVSGAPGSPGIGS